MSDILHMSPAAFTCNFGAAVGIHVIANAFFTIGQRHLASPPAATDRVMWGTDSLVSVNHAIWSGVSSQYAATPYFPKYMPAGSCTCNVEGQVVVRMDGSLIHAFQSMYVFSM